MSPLLSRVGLGCVGGGPWRHRGPANLVDVNLGNDVLTISHLIFHTWESGLLTMLDVGVKVEFDRSNTFAEQRIQDLLCYENASGIQNDLELISELNLHGKLTGQVYSKCVRRVAMIFHLWEFSPQRTWSPTNRAILEKRFAKSTCFEDTSSLSPHLPSSWSHHTSSEGEKWPALGLLALAEPPRHCCQKMKKNGFKIRSWTRFNPLS